MITVTSRLLALMMALLIGSPVCWCCAQSDAPVKKAARSCCERKREKEQETGSKKESCPCSKTVIQRDVAKNAMVVPPPMLAAPIALAVVEILPRVVFHEASCEIPWNDTGPPQRSVPVYLRQQSLLL
jgi:hypothetical protein